MRILLVEDKPDFAASLEKAIRIVGGCDLVWKKSKTGALAALADEPFDVVILDRRVPSDDEVLDDHENHGWDVFQSIKQNQPGTSVWFLTGTVDADFSSNFLNAYSTNGDIHACGRLDSVYRVFWKHNLSDCIAAVRDFRDDIQRTEAVNLVQMGDPVNLRQEEVRLFKLFGRQQNGNSVEVRPLTGGLSGARVFRVTVINASGQTLQTSVARIGSSADIGDERNRYRTEIVRLAVGSFPQVTGELEFGASGFAGIFFGVVGADITNLFDKLLANPASCAQVPTVLRNSEAVWIGSKQVDRVRVAAIRRRLIGDAALAELQAELQGINIEPVECVEVDAAQCVQHGDLHCANVLFDDRDQPMFIDYPETGLTFASVDPVFLELSTIFHKDAPATLGWPTCAHAEQWTNIDAFMNGAAFGAFLCACREWAYGVAGSEQEVWAVGYGYALCQLKYADTDKVLARAIIHSCMTRLTGNS